MLAACEADPGDEDPGDEQLIEAPTPYEPERPDVPESTLDLDELGSALSEFANLAVVLDLRPIFVLYQDLLGRSADPACPYRSAVVTNPEMTERSESIGGECLASDGLFYHGYGLQTIYSGATTGFQLVLLATLVDLDTNDFLQSAAGMVQLRTTDPEGLVTYDKAIDGGVLGSSGDPLLGGQVQLDADIQAGAYGAIRFLSITGGVATTIGELTAASFIDFNIATAEAGWPCGGEPGGEVTVRDAAGQWYEVVFDGPTDLPPPAAWDASKCDGCGEVWFRGDVIGTVCADFSALLQWEEPLW